MRARTYRTGIAAAAIGREISTEEGTPMTRTIINSPNGPKVLAPLSHAVKVGDLVFVSGMPPYFGNREFVEGDFTAQFHQSIKNLAAVLEEAGSSLDKVVKVMVYLRRGFDFLPMKDLY